MVSRETVVLVILSEAKDLLYIQEILRYAQNDIKQNDIKHFYLKNQIVCYNIFHALQKRK